MLALLFAHGIRIETGSQGHNVPDHNDADESERAVSPAQRKWQRNRRDTVILLAISGFVGVLCWTIIVLNAPGHG